MSKDSVRERWNFYQYAGVCDVVRMRKASKKQRKQNPNVWNVYLNGNYIGLISYYPIWVRKNDRQYFFGDLEEQSYEDLEDLDEIDGDFFESYWSVSVGNVENPSDAAGRYQRRNGESISKVRYRIMEMMVREYLERNPLE